MWCGADFTALAANEVGTLRARILKLLTVSTGMFNEALRNIDEGYPFSMSPKLILALLILIGLCSLVIGMLFIWCRGKTSLTTSAMGNLHNLIPSLKEKVPTLDSLLPILAERTLPQNAGNALTSVTVPQQTGRTC